MSCLYIYLFFPPVLTSASPSEISARKHVNHWHRYFMFSLSGFQKKQDQDCLLFCSTAVWKRAWGGMSWDTWEVSGADLWTQWNKYIYFVRHPTKSSENTHGEWEEYCTSNVLSLSIKPYGNLHPTGLLPLYKNKSVDICIISLQNYRKHNLDS